MSFQLPGLIDRIADSWRQTLGLPGPQAPARPSTGSVWADYAAQAFAPTAVEPALFRTPAADPFVAPFSGSPSFLRNPFGGANPVAAIFGSAETNPLNFAAPNPRVPPEPQPQAPPMTPGGASGGGSGGFGGGGDVTGLPTFNGSSAVGKAIDAQTNDPRIRLAMRMAAQMEGGNLEGGWGIGDQNLEGSYGPYQINYQVHKNAISREDSLDPYKATAYMLPEFQRAVDKVDPALWQSDPYRAAAMAAYYAERPAQMYADDRISWARGQLQQRVIQNAAKAAGAPGGPGGAWSGGNLSGITPDQFNSGLSSADAISACGPAAAVAFARATGRNPTVGEAVNLAKQVGWTPQRGMAGPASQVALLQRMGIQSHLEQGVNWQRVAQEVMAGRPVIIDTPQHYLVVESYNPQTGQFNFGNSAKVLRASRGNAWFTPQQMLSLGIGAGRSSIYMS